MTLLLLFVFFKDYMKDKSVFDTPVANVEEMRSSIKESVRIVTEDMLTNI